MNKTNILTVDQIANCRGRGLWVDMVIESHEVLRAERDTLLATIRVRSTTCTARIYKASNSSAESATPCSIR